MKKSAILFIALIILFGKIEAQEIQIDELLGKAEKSAEKYVEVFKNLIAEESKTIEIFKKDGNLENRREIKSNFIVYELQKDNRVMEFRTVLEFNGKKVSQTDEDIVNFFEKLAKSDNASEEFKKVNSASFRYDGGYINWGWTLHQDILQNDFRKIFDFKITGKEKIGDRNVYVVEYKQKEYSIFVLVSPTKEEVKKANKDARRIKVGFEYNLSISDKLKPTNPRVNGKMWLDAETGELWKNEYEISIKPAILEKPIVINKSSFEYQPSKFNIAVPKTISLISYQTVGKQAKDITAVRSFTTTLNYSNFSQLNSNVKDYEVKKQ